MTGLPRPETLSLEVATPVDLEVAFRDINRDWITQFPHDVWMRSMRAFLAAAAGTAQYYVLVDPAPSAANDPPRERTVYVSCATIHVPILVARCSATPPTQETAYGVWDVHTPVRFRRRGYASHALAQLHRRMRAGTDLARSGGPATASYLYASVRGFYSKLGFVELPYSQLALKVPAAAAGRGGEAALAHAAQGTRAIRAGELAAYLDAQDAKLRRQLLLQPSTEGGLAPTRFGLVAMRGALQARLAQEGVLMQTLHGRTPTAHGAVCGSVAAGNRVWAIWDRILDYAGEDGQGPLETTLILHCFVVENERLPRAELLSGVRCVVAAAIREAQDWEAANIVVAGQLDGDLTLGLIREAGYEYTYQRSSMPSPHVAWYASEPGESPPHLQWVHNNLMAI